jgi:hypothetical protein
MTAILPAPAVPAAAARPDGKEQKMSDKQSDLAPTGFDYVVAVTQDSINATLEEYLFGGLPEVIICYTYDESTPPNLVPIDYAVLVASANKTDPFSVPDGTSGRDPMPLSLFFDHAAVLTFALVRMGLASLMVARASWRVPCWPGFLTG